MSLSGFERRLATTWFAFGLFQTALFSLLSWLYHFSSFGNILFFSSVFAWHLGIWTVLFCFRSLFTELDGRPLHKIGLPNVLTLMRLSSLPSMTVIFLMARNRPDLAWPLVIFVSLAFLTDLADGFLARTFHMGTRLGQLIDSSSDYMILFALTLILGFSGVLPLWLLTLILVRLIFQISGSAVLLARAKKPLLETTWLGKASLFALMVLYALEILVFLRWHGLAGSLFLRSIEYFTGALMLVSLFDKAAFFYHRFKNGPDGPT